MTRTLDVRWRTNSGNYPGTFLPYGSVFDSSASSLRPPLRTVHATPATDPECSIPGRRTRHMSCILSRIVPRSVMSHPLHILCFSRSPVLLATRCAVLATRYDVVSANSLQDIARLSSGPAFDLVLLCHTLPTDECHAAAEFARHCWPGCKILALTSGAQSCAGTEVDRDLPGLEGPAALLRAIQDLTQNGHHSGNLASI